MAGAGQEACVKCNRVEKRNEIFHAYDHYTPGTFHRKLLGGTTIVETIFMWDGVGKMAVDAITMRDYPIVQAYVAWMAIIYVVVNLVTDILYHYMDPRVRLGGDQA